MQKSSGQAVRNAGHGGSLSSFARNVAHGRMSRVTQASEQRFNWTFEGRAVRVRTAWPGVTVMNSYLMGTMRPITECAMLLLMSIGIKFYDYQVAAQDFRVDISVTLSSVSMGPWDPIVTTSGSTSASLDAGNGMGRPVRA